MRFKPRAGIHGSDATAVSLLSKHPDSIRTVIHQNFGFWLLTDPTFRTGAL